MTTSTAASRSALAALLFSVAITAGAFYASPARATSQRPGKNPPHANNVVIIIMENRDYDPIIGSSAAPYVNRTLVPQSALMTDSHAVAHPSQPNYLALFSGSTQGIVNDSCPHTLGTDNLGAELIAAGKTFDGYSESMPIDGYGGCGTGEYARKHNPWVNFTNVPSTSNLIYSGFPHSAPDVAIVIPNLCNDMHDCSTRTGDAWLKKNVPPILKYNRAHNGLLILTWDEAEPDRNGSNRIATLLVGPTVVPGSYNQHINHYSVLRTIETIEGIPCIAYACQASFVENIWR